MTKRIIFSLVVSALILSSSLVSSVARAQSEEVPVVDESESNVGTSEKAEKAEKADKSENVKAKDHKKKAAHKKKGEHKKGKKHHQKKKTAEEAPHAN